MLWKLLRRNISAWQIAGYAVSCLIGMAIVLCAVQLYLDLRPAFTPDNTPGHYMVVSKPVSTRDTFRGTTPSFSQAEIADIAAQPWAADVAPFRAADFNVSASVSFGARSMSTAMFFESLPDRFIELPDSSQWTFDPGRPLIPIVIPRDYLALYNFGFAASGGMPAMSESLISSVPLTVTISGRGDAGQFPARIVGYSDWLNTIAVPDDFITWAHGRYGRTDSPQNPSRLVITTDQAGNPAIGEYLEAHGYVLGGAPRDLERASYLLTVITTAVAAVGAIITALAIGILILSLYLLVQKNRIVISRLLQLGYTPGRISAGYIRLIVAVNAAVLVTDCVALLVLRRLWETPLAALGISASGPAVPLLVAAALVLLITLLGAAIISRLVRHCF